MLDFVFGRLRSVLRAGNRESFEERPLAEKEIIREALDALHRATDSIEQYAEVIESLATSVGPLNDSLNQLTETTEVLVALMSPLGDAARGTRTVDSNGDHHDEAERRGSGT